VTASFTDPGTNDIHTCSVTFGDGSPAVTGTITESGGTGTCTASHSYPVTALGPRTITVMVTDDDSGAGSAQVNVVIFLPGAAFAIEASGLVNVPRTPDVTCPPNESQTIARLNLGVGTINGLNASCTLDPATGTTVATSSVGDARLLGGLIRVTAIQSRCAASAAGIVRSSSVGTINGIPIGTGSGAITIGLATVYFNETTTNAAGEFVQNAIRIRVPPLLLIPGQEIILAGCRLG
jgi:hypothetical protein